MVNSSHVPLARQSFHKHRLPQTLHLPVSLSGAALGASTNPSSRLSPFLALSTSLFITDLCVYTVCPAHSLIASLSPCACCPGVHIALDEGWGWLKGRTGGRGNNPSTWLEGNRVDSRIDCDIWAVSSAVRLPLVRL